MRNSHVISHYGKASPGWEARLWSQDRSSGLNLILDSNNFKMLLLWKILILISQASLKHIIIGIRYHGLCVHYVHHIYRVSVITTI